ncbi:hypothetical protein [Psychromonas sp. Urea-02u-13]|uniref:hypothetical protein n=1 Tax=Psychromonas sp. Urea-02u-13 TaxID=2058326 RepID=UPI000C330876|nr:hypothetical protein [Psychromonas sp. Urea-02u-13]PKG37709.1 hypothetical protein CXF74_17390 [Psychromonas sp. Urea-02u-13]
MNQFNQNQIAEIHNRIEELTGLDESAIDSIDVKPELSNIFTLTINVGRIERVLLAFVSDSEVIVRE